tara:strand:- start:26899 stop:27090 length:192 start_codon:yes stop_codon:yes gene_type:complete
MVSAGFVALLLDLLGRKAIPTARLGVALILGMTLQKLSYGQARWLDNSAGAAIFPPPTAFNDP